MSMYIYIYMSQKKKVYQNGENKRTSRRKKNWFGLRLALCTVTNLGVCVAAIVRMLGVLALVRLVWFGVSLVSRCSRWSRWCPAPLSRGNNSRLISPCQLLMSLCCSKTSPFGATPSPSSTLPSLPPARRLLAGCIKTYGLEHQNA